MPSRILALFVVLLAPPALAAEPSAVLDSLGQVRVVEVVDGDTVMLEDGRQVRLVGTQAPKLPLGRPDFRAWPLADEAKAALEALALGRMVELRAGPDAATVDRHGRVLAHLFDADGRWIQGAMVEAGLARVYSFADNRALAPELLALESAARDAGRGIWAHAYYAVRTPDEAEADLDTFQLVEGEVLDAEVRERRAFLNFGPDRRTDFTAYVDGPALNLFEADGIALDALAGRRVRVRGWIGHYNGPEIELTHPEQLEVLVP
jgi:endonuclease YncB( thermonuclease family)